MAPPIFHYDYEMSPYGQKTKLLLHVAGVPFKRVDQPVVLPRSDLEDLGITYRRIPVLAVGKDFYCDSSLIFNVVLDNLAKSNVKRGGPSDRAWEAWGTETFLQMLTLIPGALLSDEFVKDRQTVFPIVARSDYGLLRSSGLAEFRSRLSFLENEVLGQSGGPFMGGKDVSVADMHVVWSIRWALTNLGVMKEAGMGKEDFPKVWAMIEGLPESKAEVVGADQAKEAILGSEYWVSETGIEKGCPLGLEAGTKVTVESLDSEPNSHPQAGKLVGTSVHEVVLELDNGIRVHFPRQGYIVKEASGGVLQLN